MPSLKHIAIVKFKPTIGDQQISDFFEALGRLRETISGILDSRGARTTARRV